MIKINDEYSEICRNKEVIANQLNLLDKHLSGITTDFSVVMTFSKHMCSFHSQNAFATFVA